MSYVLKGRLCGYICDDCQEPLSGVVVRLYAPTVADRVTALAAASPKDTFAVLTPAQARKRGKPIAEATLDDQGRFSIELDEKTYKGGAFEVDVYCPTVPRPRVAQERQAGAVLDHDAPAGLAADRRGLRRSVGVLPAESHLVLDPLALRRVDDLRAPDDLRGGLADPRCDRDGVRRGLAPGRPAGLGHDRLQRPLPHLLHPRRLREDAAHAVGYQRRVGRRARRLLQGGAGRHDDPAGDAGRRTRPRS